MATIAMANMDFALRLLRKLGEDESGNLFFSPASISLALGMTYGGAAGQTKEEMESVLFGGFKDAGVHEGLGALVKTLNVGSEDYALHAANRLYAQKDFEFKREFLDLCSGAYQSSLEAVDFKEAEKVRQAINKWVESATKDRIKELIAEGILDDLTRLVLVNAIYFKGSWAMPFPKGATYKETFHISPEQKVEVDMMHQTDEFGYTEDDKVQVLRLDYKGSDKLAMYIFLPRERFGLEAWLRGLSAEKLNKLIGACRRQEVEISLPKWRMETSFQLNDALKALGMTEAFHPDRANFAAMIGGDVDANRLHISDVIHKAFLELNEEGSEAAAATAVAFAFYSSAIKIPVIFEANKPFAFAILHDQDLLFIGAHARPC